MEDNTHMQWSNLQHMHIIHIEFTHRHTEYMCCQDFHGFWGKKEPQKPPPPGIQTELQGAVPSRSLSTMKCL